MRGKRQLRRVRIGRVLGYAVIMLWVALIAWLAVPYVRALLSMSHEASTEGTVVSNTVWNGGYYTKRGGNVVRHASFVHYRYSVDGRSFEKTEGVVNAGPAAGKPVTVYYDVRDPAHSTLEGFEASARAKLPFVVGSVLGLGLMLVSVWMDQQKTKRRARKA